MSKPVPGTYSSNFDSYIDLVNEDDLQEAFKAQGKIINNFFDTITEEKSGYAYAPGKWTLKEMLLHVIDAERIFSYRALSFARKETASLPGFDENHYAAHSMANLRSWKSLVDEMKVVRVATETLYRGFTPETLSYQGIANNNSCSANVMAFVSIGHLNHHRNIIMTRYLSISST